MLSKLNQSVSWENDKMAWFSFCYYIHVNRCYEIDKCISNNSDFGILFYLAISLQIWIYFLIWMLYFLVVIYTKPHIILAKRLRFALNVFLHLLWIVKTLTLDVICLICLLFVSIWDKLGPDLSIHSTYRVPIHKV